MEREIVGSTLRRIRTDKHLSQNYVTKNILTTRQYKNIESGKSSIKVIDFFDILNRMNITLADFWSAIPCSEKEFHNNACCFNQFELKEYLTEIDTLYDHDLALCLSVINSSDSKFLVKLAHRILNRYTSLDLSPNQFEENLKLLIQIVIQLVSLNSIQKAEKIWNLIPSLTNKHIFKMSVSTYLEYQLLTSILFSTNMLSENSAKSIDILKKCINNNDFEEILKILHQ